jgi:uncharacterized LabA/DUF88 family protein
MNIDIDHLRELIGKIEPISAQTIISSAEYVSGRQAEEAAIRDLGTNIGMFIAQKIVRKEVDVSVVSDTMLLGEKFSVSCVVLTRSQWRDFTAAIMSMARRHNMPEMKIQEYGSAKKED